MIIAFNNETFNKNIEYDHKPGSKAGDIIIHQDANNPKENEYPIEYFDLIPDTKNLHGHQSLQSKKSSNTSSIKKVFIFEKFEVNGVKFDTDSKFIVFLRESGEEKRKLRLIFQSSRVISEENIDNERIVNEISSMLNDKAFSIQALEYKPLTETLNFIIFLYGDKSKSSEIFRNPNRLQRKLRGYNHIELENWSNMEFVAHVTRLVRRFELFDLMPILRDDMYCNRNFGLPGSLFKNDNMSGVYKEAVFVGNEKLYVSNKINENSRTKLWNWLLERIEYVSDEVIYESNIGIFKGLKVPNYIKCTEKDSHLILNFGIDKSKSRSYLYSNQKIYEGNMVLLVNDNIDKILRYSLFKIVAMREEVLILKKTDLIINRFEEMNILNIIKKEISDGY